MTSPAQASAAAPATTTPVNRATLSIVFLTVFIDLLGFGIVLPLLPRYAVWFNASGLQLSLLMASFSAMQFLFAPLWGSLSDRVGRRPILLLGLLGSSCSYGLFGWVSSQTRDFVWLGLGPLGWLLATRIGAGIAGATISTAQAVIADSTPVGGRGKGMALIGAAFGIGFTFGPLIGAACVLDDQPISLNVAQMRAMNGWEADPSPIDADTFQKLMQDAGTLDQTSLNAISLLLKQPIPRAELKQQLLKPPSSLPGYIASALSFAALLLAAARLQESREPGRLTGGHRAFRPATVLRHLTRPQLGIVLAAVFITTFGFAQFESTLSLLTQHFGYSNRSNYLLYAYVGFVLSLGQGMLVRRLLPRIGERKMALTGVLLMTVGFALIGLTSLGILPPAALWAILPVVVIGFSSVNPSLQSLLSQTADADEQGAVLGTGQSLSALARIFGPVFGISLLGWSLAFPYFFGGALILGGGLLVLRMPHRPHPLSTPAHKP
ncbi:MAG: Metal-tetracycline/H(+) antiporter [Planctomycetota bacterium]